MSASVYSTPVVAKVQFGNPRDSSGYRIVEAEVLAERKGFSSRIYLVRDGKTYGIATLDAKRGYYCTNAMTLGMVFRGHPFTAEDLSRHFSFPAELFV